MRVTGRLVLSEGVTEHIHVAALHGLRVRQGELQGELSDLHRPVTDVIEGSLEDFPLTRLEDPECQEEHQTCFLFRKLSRRSNRGPRG